MFLLINILIITPLSIWTMIYIIMSNKLSESCYKKVTLIWRCNKVHKWWMCAGWVIRARLPHVNNIHIMLQPSECANLHIRRYQGANILIHILGQPLCVIIYIVYCSYKSSHLWLNGVFDLFPIYDYQTTSIAMIFAPAWPLSGLDRSIILWWLAPLNSSDVDLTSINAITRSDHSCEILTYELAWY